MCHVRQRDHRLLAGADRRSGRGCAAPGGADRIGREIARRIRRDRGGAAGLAGRDECAGHRVARLRAPHGSARRADIDLFQRLGALPVLRRHLHDDVVLVARHIDGRDLALPERVIERIVDLADRDPEPGRGVAVDHQVGFKPLVLLVAVDVGENRDALKRRSDLRAPFVQLLERRALQGVLILGIARPPADANVLDRLQEQRRSRHHGERASQPDDDLIDRQLALAERLQRHEHESRIGLAAAGEPDSGIHRRIILDDGDELRELLLHQLERDALVRLDLAGHQSGILLRKESLRNDVVQIEVEPQHRD